MMIEKGFFNRMKKMQTMRMLGGGMDLGPLNEYSFEICFLLIQNIFLRELRENHHRTREDMLFIAEKILQEMDLSYDPEATQRVVDGTLWFRDPMKQESFKARIFHEETGRKEEFAFRYFKVDREHSHWEQGGSTVYMLTEESQEMIFITREILEEFGFDLEQFYTLQLIKTGNFTKARGSIDNLMARVRTLITREKEYRRDILRDPQNIFFDQSSRGNKSEEEIKAQFDEEQKVFEDMFTWRSRYDALPTEKKQEAETMFEKLGQARALHDRLAKLVTENFALEMEIRVKYPESFWNTASHSFKKDIWQNHIVKNGLEKIEDLEAVVAPLFSPKTDFIYPLDWAWGEQQVYRKRTFKHAREELLEEDWTFREIDWELLTDLYEDVFRELLEKGKFSIRSLSEKSEPEQGKWLQQRENIDLFMMFVIADVKLDRFHTGEDERLRVYKALCDRNPDFHKLHGKRITSAIEDAGEVLLWEEVLISPYTIYLEE